MAQTRMTENSIDASLDALLRGANSGDSNQARQLHDMLDQMLNETETSQGQLWLTDHARMLLAGMHRELAHCEETGPALQRHVLDAVWLKRDITRWKDSCTFVNDLRVAIAVANELCEQTTAGGSPNIDAAAMAVEANGGFGLSAAGISEIYEEIAATVGGFKEISSH